MAGDVSSDTTTVSAVRIARNTIWLGVSKALVTVMAFAYSVYVTRYLGRILTGRLTIATSWTWTLMFFGTWGMGTLLTRDVARKRSIELANHYLINALVLNVLFSILAYLPLVVLMPRLGYSEDTLVAARIMGLNIGLSAVTTSVFCVFRAYERMQFDAMWDIVNRALLLVGGLVIVARGLGLLEIATLQVVVGGVGVAFVFVMLMRFFFRPRFRSIEPRFWAYLVKASLPFGLASILLMAYNQLDVLLLSLFRDDSAVGLYNVAIAFTHSLNLIPTVILGALFPAIAAASDSLPALQMLYERTYKVLLAVALPAAVGVTLLARRFIPDLYTSAFDGAIPVLQVLVWGTVLYFVRQLFGYGMMATNLSGVYAWLSTGGVLLKAALGLALITIFRNAIGMAIAAVLIELAFALVACVFLFRQVGRVSIILPTLQVGFASLVMAVSIWLLDRVGLMWLAITLPAACVYGFVLVIVGGVSKREIQLLLKVIHGESP